jgi:hypothetical protein
MNIIIALLPFLAFALTEQFAGVLAGLASAAVVALLLCARDWLGTREHSGVLELVSLLLFGSLVIYVAAFSPEWSLMSVRVVADSGLFLVMLASLLIGRPFTLSYAQPDPHLGALLSPRFIRSHYYVSGLWTAVLLLVVVIDTVILLWPSMAIGGAVAMCAALLAAVHLTLRHAASLRA